MNEKKIKAVNDLLSKEGGYVLATGDGGVNPLLKANDTCVCIVVSDDFTFKKRDINAVKSVVLLVMANITSSNNDDAKGIEIPLPCNTTQAETLLGGGTLKGEVVEFKVSEYIDTEKEGANPINFIDRRTYKRNAIEVEADGVI